MNRALSAVIAAVVVSSLTAGCANLARVRAKRRPAPLAAKDCSACEKMCAVAGDVEENPAAVADCQADCRQRCTP